MKRICSIAVLIIIFASAGPLFADSVYFWTDENGVRHYSNTGVPEGVDEANVRPEEKSPDQPAASDEESEADVDKDSPSQPPKDGDPEEAASGEGKEEVDERLAARAEKERRRLEREIKKIKAVPVSRTNSQGRKDARIKALEEQLALLEADPKRYFRMKRQGAFDSSTASDSEGDAAPPPDPLADQLSSGDRSSSTGGSKEDEASSQEEGSENDENDDGDKSRRARSSGSASETLAEESPGPPGSPPSGSLTPNQNYSSGRGTSDDDSSTQDEGSSEDKESGGTRSIGAQSESLSQGYSDDLDRFRPENVTSDQDYTTGGGTSGDNAPTEAPTSRGTVSRGSDTDAFSRGGELYPSNPRSIGATPGQIYSTGRGGSGGGDFPF